ncbi:MAG: MarR family transcriptional regulator [Actinobacteria bacterium]|nr:MarR family transcriptional regulator [Actinomycetota bacterium]
MFASTHDVSNNDMDALLHIVVSEAAGTPLSAGELAQRLRISGPAVTYLVDRMIQAGHIQRETHHSDRRKVVLRYSENGLRVAQLFFEPLREHNRTAMADLADQDLAAAHRVLTALSGAINAYRAELDRPAIT